MFTAKAATMKTIIPLMLFASLTLLSCHKNTDQIGNGKDCTVTDEVRTRYTKSVYQMMMQRYREDTTLPQYRNAMLSATERDEILGYIQAVYNLNTPERDTVFKMDSITEYPVVSLYNAILQIDPNSAQGKNLMGGKPSGNSDFDALLTKYGIDSLRTLLSSPGTVWIVARTATPHNMIQVAKELRPFSFIYSSEADGYMGDGDRIKLAYLESFAAPSPVELDFSIGRGDCPAGCNYRRHWVFHVTDCNATFIKSY